MIPPLEGFLIYLPKLILRSLEYSCIKSKINPNLPRRKENIGGSERENSTRAEVHLARGERGSGVVRPASSPRLSSSIRLASSFWLHLLKATSLFSVYISGTAMARDTDATGVCGLSRLGGENRKRVGGGKKRCNWGYLCLFNTDWKEISIQHADSQQKFMIEVKICSITMIIG